MYYTWYVLVHVYLFLYYFSIDFNNVMKLLLYSIPELIEIKNFICIFFSLLNYIITSLAASCLVQKCLLDFCLAFLI